MEKQAVVNKIEQFAPLELAEKWDCSGWVVDVACCKDVSKVMLCLTVTENVIEQARKQKCDMIISHHPLFYVPLAWKDINIYCAHTNMDKTEGGTTDVLVKTLGLELSQTQEFLRYVEKTISVENFGLMLKKISPNLRYVNNSGVMVINKIAFCAGSGSEFIKEACENGADCFVTGDLKFHTALDSPIVVFDVGHFESEIMILDVFEKLVEIETVRAEEKSPFMTLTT